MKLILIHQASSVLTANWSTLSMRISGEKKEIKSALIHLLLWVDTLLFYMSHVTCGNISFHEIIFLKHLGMQLWLQIREIIRGGQH